MRGEDLRSSGSKERRLEAAVEATPTLASDDLTNDHNMYRIKMEGMAIYNHFTRSK